MKILQFKFDTDYLLEGELENMGGLDSFAYIALARWIKEYPTLVPTPTDDEQVVTLQGDFVMKDGFAFIQCYSTPTKTGFDSESQGEIDGKSFHSVGEIHYPGNGIDAVALARKLNNARGVAIFTDGDGHRLVIGDRGRPCTFSVSAMNGKAPTDPKEIVITCMWDGHLPHYKYNGNIPLLSGGESSGDTFSISAVPTSITSPADDLAAKTIAFTTRKNGVVTNLPITITSNAPAWLNVSLAGNTVTATLTAANAGNQRYHDIKVAIDENPSTVATVRFTQQAAVAPPVPVYEIITPKMASVNQDGFAASASSSVHSPHLAFDQAQGDALTNDAWQSGSGSFTGGVGSQWLKIALPAPEVVVFYKVRTRGSTASQASPTDFELEGSNDNQNWTSLQIVKGIEIEGIYGAYESKVENSTAYQYYRLKITRIRSSSVNQVAIGELELYRAGSPPSGTEAYHGWLPTTTPTETAIKAGTAVDGPKHSMVVSTPIGSGHWFFSSEWGDATSIIMDSTGPFPNPGVVGTNMTKSTITVNGKIHTIYVWNDELNTDDGTWYPSMNVAINF